MPEISVIIPTYNRAAYVTQAIDSVLEQTYRDVEIIVVDDGSTDDTRARVEAYGDRVTYVLTWNGGTGHARNVGMRAARGKYLAFLDSDDVYYPFALELQKRILDRYPQVGMVYAEMSVFDDHGFYERYYLKTYHRSAYRDRRITYDRIFSSSVRLDDTGALPDRLVKEDLRVGDRRAYFGNIFDWYLTNLVLFQNSVMLRREIIPAVGERNERIRYWEEVEYLRRIVRRHAVCFLDVPTYKLRFHEGQVSSAARKDDRFVWIRKQQILLRLTKREAHVEAEYYQRHRARIDAHLANLHRAVAVPMMLSDSAAHGSQKRYVGASRCYLEKCRALGHPQWTLWLLTFAPGALRRAGVSIMEICRSWRTNLRTRVIPDNRLA